MGTILLNFIEDEINAQEFKERLNNASIECTLQKEQKTIITSLSDSVEECVAVYVDEKDCPEAMKILESFEQEMEKRGIWCPECDSEDVTVKVEPYRYKPAWPLSLCAIAVLISCVLSFFYNVFIILTCIIIIVWYVLRMKNYGTIRYNVKTYHCNNCGKDFSEDDKF